MESPYKTLNFSAGKIPDGLKREHRLKAGVRGILQVTSGELVFVDHDGTKTRLAEGERIAIQPDTLHHLEEAEQASISIAFYRDEV